MSAMRGRPWAVLVVLSLAYFMAQLDISVLTLAIPSIRRTLHASAADVTWALGGYTFVLAVMLITAGRLGDLWGRGRVFLVGVALFTVCSLADGLARNPGELIAARAVQGLGAALLMPQTMALLVEVFPPDKRGTALGVRGAVGGAAAVLGPVIGGLLVSGLGWRWVFLINVPVGVALLLWGALTIPKSRTAGTARLDMGGVLLASGALLCFSVAVNQGQRYHWNGWIWALLAAAAVLAAAFARQQRRRQDREPLVPFGLLRDRNYKLMNGFGATISLTVIGLILTLSFYFQSVLGYSALEAGLLIVPASLFSMLLDPLAGKLSATIEGKYLLLFGAVCTVAGMAWTAAEMHTGTNWPVFVAPMCVIGVGNAFLFTPLAAVALYDVTPELAGAASGVLVTALQIGSMVGTALVGTFLGATHATALSPATARTAMLLLLLPAALAALTCLPAHPNLRRATSPHEVPADDGVPATD